ncbi:hypothetical protein JCM33374_g1257 [Metschnikowia sp. JCM 33374]|nr:hypothetical protein JCM33374_g1257 [Metschnikowia sp. JCM 33374]
MKANFVLLLTTIFASVATGSKHQLEEPHKAKMKNISPKPFGRTVHVYKNEDGTIHVRKQNTKQLLDGFMNHLKTFVNDTHFDVYEFEDTIDIFGTLLADIESSAANQSNMTTVLDSLTFVNLVYQRLLYAVDSLRAYDIKNSPPHRLIYNAIELNVRLLLMYDINGDLDRTIPDASSKVRFLWRCTYYWRMCFETLKNVSPAMRSLFEDQIEKAEDMLAFFDTFFLNMDK